MTIKLQLHKPNTNLDLNFINPNILEILIIRTQAQQLINDLNSLFELNLNFNILIGSQLDFYLGFYLQQSLKYFANNYYISKFIGDADYEITTL